MSDDIQRANKKLFEEIELLRKDIKAEIHRRCGNNRVAPYIDTQTKTVKTGKQYYSNHGLSNT